MMSASRVIHLEHLYELAHWSPVIIMSTGIILFVLIMAIVAHFQSHVWKYHLDKLYPNLRKYLAFSQYVLVVCVFLSISYGLLVGAGTSVPKNYTKINHVVTAVKYQKELPKLEHQSNGVHTHGNEFVYDNSNKIAHEKKYIKKYRYMKPIKKPTVKDYLMHK